jgi:hypothetical protein
MVDPALSPIDLGLECCEPWVAKDYFVLPQVGQEELKCGLFRSGLDLQVSEKLEFSALVRGAIDVTVETMSPRLRATEEC